MWPAASFIGKFLADYLGTDWSSTTKSGFFLMLALVSAAAGLIIAALHRPLREVLRE